MLGGKCDACYGLVEPALVIPLTRGFVAVVDREDYDRIAAHKWNAMVHGGRLVYAVRHRPNTEGGIIYMHREVSGGARVDHIAHPPGVVDNRRRNLRIVTACQNAANSRKVQRACQSIFKGVAGTAGKSTKPWRAYITVRGRRRSLGHFWQEGMAALAYDVAALQAHGEHALTNFPIPGSRSWLHG